MERSNQPSAYCAWLLRCWSASDSRVMAPSGWWFRLEAISTGETYSFATVDALIAFLRQQFVSSTLEISGRPHRTDR